MDFGDITARTMRTVDADMIGENARPTTLGDMLTDLREIIIPWLRENNPDNAWVPTSMIFKACKMSPVRVGQIAGRCPRYLESHKECSTLFVRLHKHLA